MDPKDRKYTNGEITVHWKPAECIHATTCYRELIKVFNPRKRPWINMEGAPSEKIIEIVRKCPTQALTYDWNDPDKVSDKPGAGAFQFDEGARIRELKGQPVEIRIMKNGPYVAEGLFSVIDSSGEHQKSQLMTSFCSCGASGDMPFCDGTHRIENFTDNTCD